MESEHKHPTTPLPQLEVPLLPEEEEMKDARARLAAAKRRLALLSAQVQLIQREAAPRG